MSVPDEAERKPPVADLKEAAEGGEPISDLSLLRQQPVPATTFQLLKDAVCGYSPVSILSQLTVRYFLFGETNSMRSHRRSTTTRTSNFSPASLPLAIPFRRGEGADGLSV